MQGDFEGAKEIRRGWKIEKPSFAGRDERHIPSLFLSLFPPISLSEFTYEILHPRRDQRMIGEESGVAKGKG